MFGAGVSVELTDEYTNDLKNKPLTEAVFELRWKLTQVNHDTGADVDLGYRLMPGRLYEALKHEYPYFQELPTAKMPDEMVQYNAQYRFRKDKEKWPLIQLGPGLLTVNDTQSYTWDDFRKRIDAALTVLYNNRFNDEPLIPLGLILRYIDSVPLSLVNDDVLRFLTKMKLAISFDSVLFQNLGINNRPQEIDLRFTFPLEKQSGTMNSRFFTAAKGPEQIQALFWETVVQFSPVDDTQYRLMELVDEAHYLTHNWFFRMISGELLEEFR